MRSLFGILALLVVLVASDVAEARGCRGGGGRLFGARRHGSCGSSASSCGGSGRSSSACGSCGTSTAAAPCSVCTVPVEASETLPTPRTVRETRVMPKKRAE